MPGRRPNFGGSTPWLEWRTSKGGPLARAEPDPRGKYLDRGAISRHAGTAATRKKTTLPVAPTASSVSDSKGVVGRKRARKVGGSTSACTVSVKTENAAQLGDEGGGSSLQPCPSRRTREPLLLPTPPDQARRNGESTAVKTEVSARP